MPAKRTRKRLNVEKTEIVERVLRFYQDDLTSHDTDRETRLQRYAKFRMWSEDKDWPWPGCSNAAMPDMMEKSLRLQDTLHNAVMSQRPPISAKALQKTNSKKERNVDLLIDHQIFVEQQGEIAVGEMADAFVNDGLVTAFIPWVKETRDVNKITLFPPIPPEIEPADYFFALLKQKLAGFPERDGGSGWDWKVAALENDNRIARKFSFYSRDDGQIEMSERREAVVYDGPKIIVKDYDDVLHPPRAANLQMPGPSNPGGASHVILIDHPTIDEVKRLAKKGFYDMTTPEEVEELKNTARDVSEQDRETQKDDFSGSIDMPVQDEAKSHSTVTRLTCFDSYDIDGDGLDEDVIWWVVKETKTLVKARLMTEMYPSDPPRRPFAEAAFIPVKGRRRGISLLEMLEGVHDIIVQTFNQMMDSGTITNVPFFFYRASSMVKPEVMRLWPGEGYPLADPSRDVHFPNFANSGQSFGINMLTILGEMEDRLTLQSDLQSGRVPAGRSAALRTTGNLAMLMGQGEARPERILRRFFLALVEIWSQIHELNQHFLPREKEIRVIGIQQPSEDPYLTIAGPDAVSGRFHFEFKANVFNTSKQAAQASLGLLMQTYVTELAIQMGISKPDGIYRLFRDFGLAQGHDPDLYISEPELGAMKPPIFAEEAINAIMSGNIPEGSPAEGPEAHMQKLIAFAGSDDLGFLTPEQVEILKGYMAQVQSQSQTIALAQAAQRSQMGQQPGQPGRPPETMPNGGQRQMVAGDEIIDETLPSERGIQ